MSDRIHGTREGGARVHPVLDIEHWTGAFPLDGDASRYAGGGWIDGPVDLALREQAVRLAASHGDLGPSVEADVFVWSDACDRERPWLTRLGGDPWRPEHAPWPMVDGRPLLYLAQFCLLDSMDVLPFEPPGEVMLLFGTSHRGGDWVSTGRGCHVEFWPVDLEGVAKHGNDEMWNCTLPFEYQGVIHRTRQYTDWRAYEAAFRAAGWAEGGLGIGSVQATSIGTHAHLPQGWPFAEGSKDVLLATLSSLYLSGPWPLCDVASPPERVGAAGKRTSFRSTSALELGIGDAGAIWIYRDSAGGFKIDEACG
ncbi:MAG: hypothetical protein ACIAQU_05100 [Phycisphaerales bacterium JB064]